MEEINEKLLRKGDKFCSFEELEKRLAQHMEESCTIFWKRDVRTLRIAAKTIPRAASCNQDLHYYFVKYACNHGGKKFVSKKSVHSTRKSFSSKNGCGAFLLFILSDDGQSLVLKTESSIHNHPTVSRHIFKQFLRKRKSRVARDGDEPETQEKVNKKAKKPTLQINTKAENSAQNIRTKRLETENNLGTCAQLLRTRYACCVDILVSADNEPKAVFLQDKIMKETFDAYPEMLFIDGTCKVAVICATVCLFMVVDSAGVCEIVAAAVMYVDDDESFDWAAKTFKKCNRKWAAVATVMTDTDATKRSVLARHFSKAEPLICRYHVTQRFRLDVTAKKLGISQATEIVSKGYLQKLMDSPSGEAYESVYCEMLDTLPLEVLNYYNDNWHEIRTHWVYGYSNKMCVFFDDVYRPVEVLCKRLHTQVNRFTSVKQLLIDLFAQVSIQRAESENLAMSSTNINLTTDNCDSNSAEDKYWHCLTDFAYKLVDVQFKLKETVEKCLIGIANQTDFHFNATTSEKVVATASTCECSFFSWLFLPCQHMLFVRQYSHINLFDVDERAKKWTRAFHLSGKSESDAESGRCRTSAEKLAATCKLTNRMAVLCSEAGDREFEERMLVLHDLVSAWKRGKKVQVVELVDPEFFAEVEENGLEIVSQELFGT